MTFARGLWKLVRAPLDIIAFLLLMIGLMLPFVSDVIYYFVYKPRDQNPERA
jgi:hypothetical protein